ncbi:M42 family metallopeptidase [Oscillospiraceae bacterium WX1]
MLELIKALCEKSGVSGTEDAVRALIRARAEKCADRVTEDVLGNLIVFKKGRKTPKKSIMLCAHMDEVGVIVTDIADDGTLKFAPVGGIDRRVLFGKAVLLGPSRVYGVIGSKAYHLVKKDEREKIPPVEDMYIDIGAASREEAIKSVALGDTGVFDSGLRTFGNGLVKARALDDRVGCAVLLKLLESDLPVDATFVFTVQEEVGTRGALVASYRVAPDIAIIIEGTTAADLPSVSSGKKVCFVGKGAVIPFMDGGTIYDRELFALATTVAEEHGIPWQTKTTVAGGTDAAAVQRSLGGVQTLAISAPLRYLHSPACVGALDDFDAVFKLCGLLLEKVGEQE